MSRNSPSRTLSTSTKLPKHSPTSLGSLPLLAKRDNICGNNHHNCLDIDYADQCCDNQSYCYINLANQPRCCPLGSNCVADSPCNSEHFYCTTTLTSITAGNSTTQGCCGRKCPQTSYYLCPPNLGGKCCPYDSDCQAGGNCIQTYTASTTLPVPSGSGKSCSTCTPTITESMSVMQAPQLSSGAKAGIGVGIALGTSLLIALLAWGFILYKRHRRQVKEQNEKYPDPTNRSELMGAANPQDNQHATGDAADTGDGADVSAPVEMCSDEASPPEQERSASPWETGARVESIEGLFELDGLEVLDRDPSPSPPPQPNIYFPSHLDKM